MAKEVQNSRSGEIKKTAEDLDEFMNKVISSSLCFLYLGKGVTLCVTPSHTINNLY